MTSPLTAIELKLTNTIAAIPGLTRQIEHTAAGYETSRMGAASDAERDISQAAALQALRDLEKEVLDQLTVSATVAKDARRQASDLATTLSPTELATTANMATLYAAETRPDAIEQGLRTAVLTDDRPGLAYWRSRALALPSADLERPEPEPARSARRALPLLIREADTTLRNSAGDAVVALSDQLATATAELQRMIDKARSNRGEGNGIKIVSTRPMVQVDGSPLYDATGYHLVGHVGYEAAD